MNLSVECNTDYYILYTLIHRHNRDDIHLLHQEGKPGVMNRIVQKPGEVGLIDEDPLANQHPKVALFELAEQRDPFQLFINRRENRTKLIIIQPYLEQIIVDTALLKGLNPEPYSIVNDSEILHQINPYRNINYQEYLDLVLNSTDVFNILMELI